MIHNVIFDFCGVLLDWRTRACLESHFDQATVDRICASDDPCGFFRYEDRMDAGELLADIMPDIEREQGERIAGIFRYYIAHYADALPRVMPGMDDLVRDLKGKGIGVWGLTNWSSETIGLAYDKFPLLHELQDTVVSGVEHKHKPNADIYELALERFGLTASDTAFVDDTARNVEGANAMGIHGIRFHDAAQTRTELAVLTGLSL